jgi:hypothetical protein
MSKPTSETICINSTLAEIECEAIHYDTSGVPVPSRVNHKRTGKQPNRRKAAPRKKRRH